MINIESSGHGTVGGRPYVDCRCVRSGALVPTVQGRASSGPRCVYTCARILRTQARLNFYIKSYIYGVLIEGGTWREKEAGRREGEARKGGGRGSGPPRWTRGWPSHPKPSTHPPTHRPTHPPHTHSVRRWCARGRRGGLPVDYLCAPGGRHTRIRDAAPNLCARSPSTPPDLPPPIPYRPLSLSSPWATPRRQRSRYRACAGRRHLQPLQITINRKTPRLGRHVYQRGGQI